MKHIFAFVFLAVFLAASSAFAADWKVGGALDTSSAMNGRTSPAKRTINVKNTHEFYEALGSDRAIVLGPGQFAVTEFGGSPYDYFADFPNFKDGTFAIDRVMEYRVPHYELRIKGVKNLTVRGTPAGQGGTMTDFIVYPGQTNVLVFEDCENISIEYAVAGHFSPGYAPEEGEGEGGVFKFVCCKNISFEGAEMYGGTSGLRLDDCENVSLKKCVIFTCTENILRINGSKNISFDGVTFTGNRSGSLIVMNGAENAEFKHCIFEDNVGPDFISTDGNYKNVAVINSVFRGNRTWGVIEKTPGVSFIDCAFENNLADELHPGEGEGPDD